MGIGNLGDGLHFDFQDYNHQQGQESQMMHQNRASMGRPDTTMQEHMPSMTTASSHPTISGPSITNHASNKDSISELDAQIQYLQQQRAQQQQRQLQEQQRNYYSQNRMIPPTPNSIEMHGANFQPYPLQADSQQHNMYETYQLPLKDSEMAFTPLVSPAVTPLETHFNIPEYTIPGAYFSPLSSPALHAQNDQTSAYGSRHSGATNSPIDLHAESHSAPSSSVIASRKPSSRKAAVQKPRSLRSVKQSPIVKPRRAKRGSVASVSAQALGDILEPSNVQLPEPKEGNSSTPAASTDQSENGSISPEHLSDMAPPPLPQPRSASKSPYIQAQMNARTERLALGSPATPASLMRLTQSPNDTQASAGQDMDVDSQGMEDFLLPEAADSSKPALSRMDTLSDGQVTPTLSSSGAKTQFQPLPSPAFSRPNLAISDDQSPRLDPANGTNVASRKTPNIAPRGSKKRSSTSVLASPALLPRISPSIKPLLPGGGKIAEDTASLLLASKSNYQNIIEGTHLPGVSYPSELSTNLTSKRTSHKIAEQGRRNRINSALQEIATLLPRGASKDNGGDKNSSGDGPDGNEKEGGKGCTQSTNSKASTVELAIEYIKQLKQELAVANKRADDAEKQLAAKS
ncbi:hypothetical protein B0O99DRAFT_656892 [Bisporella sp. PMI_857]|nr:hypothetical protein B0O99DRAFT_656892 [Bisporella sp. PMI_857]